MTPIRLGFAFLLIVALSACAPPEDPARVELRTRLKQDTPMVFDDIVRVLNEVHRTIEGKRVRALQNGVAQDMDAPLQEIVLGMLTKPIGVFDEGLRTIGSATVRVINAPGRPSNAELDAARHLMIDVDTFLPKRFEFTSGVAADEFQFDSVVEP